MHMDMLLLIENIIEIIEKFIKIKFILNFFKVKIFNLSKYFNF